MTEGEAEMGTYYYTLRSKTMKAKDETDAGSGMMELAFFSYACKPSCVDEYTHKGRLIVNNIHRHKENAEAKHMVNGKVPFVVLADKPENGAPVYKDVTKTGWYDTDHFPGTAYGYLFKDGGRWTVVTGYDHYGERGSLSFDVPVPFVGKRYSVVDGAHKALGYHCTRPDGTKVYVACSGSDTLESLKALWKPIRDAEKAERDRKAALQAQAAQRRREAAQARKQQLAARKAALQAEMAEVDVEMRKVAWA